MRLQAALVALATLPLAGCFGAEEGGEVALQPTVLDDAARRQLEELAAPRPLRYAFPGQEARDPVVTYVNGTVTTLEAAAGYESPQDRGGTSWNTLVKLEDVSALVPAGQPVLLDIRLWYNNAPGRAADIDLVLDLPGARTHESRAFFDEWSWTLPVKTALVSTVGVEGEPAMIGVQIANGKIAPGQELRYTIRVTAHYFKDVLTPFVPYEVDVPANATGLVFQSSKHAGEVHVEAGITVVGPDDRFVAHIDYNDLAIPTETIHVPVKDPGRHVVYLTKLQGGFLSVRADAPLDDAVVRPLARVVSLERPFDAPIAPGVAEHTVYDVTATPWSEGGRANFDGPPTFPLELRPVLVSTGPTATVDVECRVASQAGLVSIYSRTARVDDERGRVGFSDETDRRNRAFFPANLTGGPYTLSVVNDGSTATIAVEVVTYAR